MTFYLLRLATGYMLLGSIVGHLISGTNYGSAIGAGLFLILFGFTYKKFQEV